MEMYEREVVILELLRERKDVKYICEYVSKKFKISPRTVETQYYQILKSISETIESEKANLRVIYMTQIDEIMERAIANNQAKTALDCIITKAKLAGLFDQSGVESKQPDVITISEKDYSGTLKVVGENGGKK